jgi:hypothetical protein
MRKHADSIDAAILDRIRSRAKDRVFTPADFLDLGSRAAIDQALSRNSRAGRIRKVGRGLYDIPKDHPRMGELSASADALVQAIARRSGLRVQASGGQAANALGLTDQVPVRLAYHTEGRFRPRQLGKLKIQFRSASSRTMATAGTVSGQVIQALRWIGRRNVDDVVVARLKRNLKDADKKQLLKDLRYAPAWVAAIMRKVATPVPPPAHG